MSVLQEMRSQVTEKKANKFGGNKEEKIRDSLSLNLKNRGDNVLFTFMSLTFDRDV